MVKYICILTLFTFFGLSAQEEVVQSVYFDTNSYQIDVEQAKEVIDFIKKTDSTIIESI